MSSESSCADRVLLIGGQPLDYRLVRSRRKTLTLVVHRDGRVEARAPLRLPLYVIEQFLAERQDWLRRKQAEFALAPPPVEYVDGASLRHFGEELRLRVHRGRGATQHIGRDLHVSVMEPEDREQVKLRVLAWYRDEAERCFPARLEAWLPAISDWGVKTPRLSYRWMRSRWGSCSRDAKITLNVQLVKAAPDAIDYVIAHELCHLREFNHSPRFYALLDELMPDWPARREALNRFGSLRTE